MRRKVMRIAVGLGVLMVVLSVATLRADEEKEKKISVSDCPKAVQKTLKRELGKGKLVDVDVRKIKGVAIYESEVWFGESEYDITVRGDGTLLAKRLERDGKDEDPDEDDENDADEEEREAPVKMDDLPKRVATTLKREARGGEIEEIVKKQEGDKVVFEAEVEFETRKGDKEYEIEIAKDGTLVCKVLEEEEGKGAKAQSGDEDDEDQEDKD
jgi:hypothetical protein